MGNILVIGNGFDLAHNLPTKYGDFLDFIMAHNITQISLRDDKIYGIIQGRKSFDKKYYKKNIQDIIDFLTRKNGLQKRFRFHKFLMKTGEEFNDYDLKYPNFWFNHFINRREEIGEGWIDFEKEILEVLKKLEYNPEFCDDLFPDILHFYISRDIYKYRNIFKLCCEEEEIEIKIKVKNITGGEINDDIIRIYDFEQKELNRIYEWIRGQEQENQEQDCPLKDNACEDKIGKEETFNYEDINLYIDVKKYEDGLNSAPQYDCETFQDLYKIIYMVFNMYALKKKYKDKDKKRGIKKINEEIKNCANKILDIYTFKLVGLASILTFEIREAKKIFSYKILDICHLKVRKREDVKLKIDEELEKIKDLMWYIYEYESKEVKTLDLYDKEIYIEEESENEFEKRYDSIIKYIVENLENDLNEFIYYFELYLKEINKLYKIKPLKLIQDLHIDKVLSFNYTDTYSAVYDKDTEVSYIHGKVRDNVDEGQSNIVLGIDEYLDEDQKDKDLKFLRFKKYFQRLYKENDREYKNWFNSENNSIEDKINTIYFFGHSLDSSDKDILEELIETPNFIIKIFYFSNEQKAQQIENLIKIIGQDKLNKYAYSEKKIEFINQTQPQHN